MFEWFADPVVYSYVKALHIVAVISWMCGLLYLPRLFVYHAQTETGSEMSETFKVMERKLLRIIMNPAMIAAWVFGGLMLVSNTGLMEQGWMHVKLTGVIVMTAVHHVYVRFFKAFRDDKNQKSHKYYRIWNEIPAGLMLVIVILAVAKPF